jgi:hypothetical protein
MNIELDCSIANETPSNDHMETTPVKQPFKMARTPIKQVLDPCA